MPDSTTHPIWTLAEVAEGRVDPVSYEVIARAAGLKGKLPGASVASILLAAPLPTQEVRKLIHHGADEVYFVKHQKLEHPITQDHASILAELAGEHKPYIFLASATTYGRTLMPYLAVRLNAGLTADCTILDIEPETELLLQTRPAIGGNILATIKTAEARPQMATVRPHSTRALPLDSSRRGKITEVIPDLKHFRSRVSFVRLERDVQDEIPITEARSIVSGGKGLKKAENFELVHRLAQRLAAAVGASREAVDRGWISYPHQIGLSGKTVTPALYLSVGISGSIQHLAGMQTASRIVAINNDSDAQIFKVADLAIVGDLFEISRLSSRESRKGRGRRMEYSRVTSDVIDRLIEICGANHVIFGDVEKLEAYSHDEVADKHYHHMPEAVVRPRTTEEISAIMRLANEKRIPVTARGAGSGLSGGAVPLYGGIVLLFDRMNSMLEIDTENLMMTVEPGVVTNEINEAVKEYGLFYAGYPMSVETCFIGGNVAENAGGGKAIKYGVTRRYVYGLECVLPNGDIVHFGGKRMKDVTGYDLVHLLVGSEGTLALFTKITLKLLPLPTASADLLVLFPDRESAIKMVPMIMTEIGIIPTAVEFMDRLAAQTTCDYLNEHLVFGEAGAMLLITVDGHDEAQVEADYETIGELCLQNEAIEVYVADNPTTSERVWRVRRNIAEALKVYYPFQSVEDIVVPFADIPRIIPKLDRISAEYDVLIPCCGHAGDGNLHATIVKKPDMAVEEWEGKLDQVLEELYRTAVSLGGTISGEHGIGHKRKKFLHLAMTPEEIGLMRRIKLAFDPNYILNPGKVFD